MAPELKATKGIFADSIKRVLSQVNVTLAISNEAIQFLDIQVNFHLFFFQEK